MTVRMESMGAPAARRRLAVGEGGLPTAYRQLPTGAPGANSRFIILRGPFGYTVSGIDEWADVAAEIKNFVFFVVGGEEDAVIGVRDLHAFATGVFGVFAGGANDGDVRVVVIDACALGFEFFDEDVAGGLAVVVDIGFVSESEEEDAGAVEGFFVGVEGLGDLLHDVVGHTGVDFAGEFDEAGVHFDFAGLPGEVERVDGDAVSAKAGAGIEGHVAERLGGGGVDDVPHVDVHLVEDHLEFVDEGDVDGAEDVFREFGGLGDTAVADGVNVVDGEGIEFDAALEAGGGVAAHDFGDGADGVVLASGVFPFGGEGEMEVDTGFEARTGLQNLS